jgi:DNA repair protein RadC
MGTHERLSEADTILGPCMPDHVIAAKKEYFSFREAGLIP